MTPPWAWGLKLQCKCIMSLGVTLGQKWKAGAHVLYLWLPVCYVRPGVLKATRSGFYGPKLLLCNLFMVAPVSSSCLANWYSLRNRSIFSKNTLMCIEYTLLRLAVEQLESDATYDCARQYYIMCWVVSGYGQP